jgi:hypothetical protein
LEQQRSEVFSSFFLPSVLLRGPKQKKKQKVLFSNFPRIFFISLRYMKTADSALLHAYP